ncbi:MAG: M48 family metalloprotease [Candidatus Riflebacteria bacterium]|nr:M48 family metalloprotease [Candidatus Riflebacteria bacterium]
MIDPVALLAFGLVFLGTSLALSGLLGAVLRCGRFLRPGSGPLARRRAATLVLALPPILALGLVLVLAAESAQKLASGTDHCLDHGHHLHLCLVHGGDWASRPLAVAFVAVLVVVMTLRSGRRAVELLLGQRAARSFKRLGRPLTADGLCRVVPSSQTFAFALGVLEPVVAVSSRTWANLAPGHRQALLAHERAHVDRRDLIARELLWTASLFGLPATVRHALSLWQLASEQLCDRQAAGAAGGPGVVAEAILAVARLCKTPPPLPPAALGADSFVVERIESLLSDEPESATAAARLLDAGVLCGLVFILGCALFSEPLHHLLETFLG